MRILFVGDDWLGSNARSLADGFRQAGHEVYVIDSSRVTLPTRLSLPWGYAKVSGRRAPWTTDIAAETGIGTAGGTDTVQAFANFRLGANVEKLILENGGIVGFGNALGNAITGNGAADVARSRIER